MALQLNGTTSVVSHGDLQSLDAPTAFTVCLWCAVNEGAASVNASIFSKTASAATNGFCHIANNGGIAFKVFIDSAAYFKTSFFPDTAEHHLGVVFNGAGAADADRLKCYRDGVNIPADAFGGTIPAVVSTSGAAAFLVGNTNLNVFMAGRFGLLKVWARALSDREILTEANSTRPQATGALLWSPYDDSATAPQDYSGNQHPGAATACALIQGPNVAYGG